MNIHGRERFVKVSGSMNEDIVEPEPSEASGTLHNAASSDSIIIDRGDLDDVEPDDESDHS
jgi:hypothetical protein